jgi:hypothetical protein
VALAIWRPDLSPSLGHSDPSRFIMWGVDDQHPIDPMASSIRIWVSPPYCSDGSIWKGTDWHKAPEVVNGGSSVTISVPMADGFDRARCWPCPAGASPCYDGYALEVEWIEVNLGQPLRGRLLFDGSQSPPSPRPYR